ncbi:hypothetical protein [Pimelobacter simplex]|uniref:hypothetical protein n=1 Tax=Nocardioides simplex TaxID=2045 RepID=UPI00214F6D88|nr:hypothetical protein [Pimelobacter simplex]UUW92555.1 hypothetical protein M0M43_14035 [Pimelobacter simplex]UUW96382.1 hypothetical protein M0M48_02665 [Pimelobacter simplex]
MSIEVDIPPIAASNHEAARLADLTEGVAGEFSPFEELHGLSIDAPTWTPPSSPTAGATVWSRCRTPTRQLLRASHASRLVPTYREMSRVAMLIALREKNRNFVAALLDGGLVNPDLIATGLMMVSSDHPTAPSRCGRSRGGNFRTSR